MMFILSWVCTNTTFSCVTEKESIITSNMSKEIEDSDNVCLDLLHKDDNAESEGNRTM